jgi:hypothetical protein
MTKKNTVVGKIESIMRSKWALEWRTTIQIAKRAGCLRDTAYVTLTRMRNAPDSTVWKSRVGRQVVWARED